MTLSAWPPPPRIATADHSDVAAWLSHLRSIEVVPVRHPILEALGHDPASNYAEQFWLPVIGPSALWAHRRLTAGFLSGEHNYHLDIATLGREIGLGAGTGRNSPIVRTLTRLVDFHLAEIADCRLGVHTTLPPLTRRQAARLPAHLAERYRAVAAESHHRHPMAAVPPESQGRDR